jgi:hypothetical protein
VAADAIGFACIELSVPRQHTDIPALKLKELEEWFARLNRRKKFGR